MNPSRRSILTSTLAAAASAVAAKILPGRVKASPAPADAPALQPEAGAAVPVTTDTCRIEVVPPMAGRLMDYRFDGLRNGRNSITGWLKLAGHDPVPPKFLLSDVHPTNLGAQCTVLTTQLFSQWDSGERISRYTMAWFVGEMQ